MDELHRHLFGVLMDREWKHGVAAAVDVTLLGRLVKKAPVKKTPVKKVAARATKASAKLENRVVPAGYVRPASVKRLLAERQTRQR
jgi:hypothetical protein